jgi:hypothetical protein
MEYPERPDAAEWTANYFATGAGGRSVSSHYSADATSVVQCVRLRDTAWTVGNRPGNNRGINWELAGYASQTREQWLDAFGRAMLERAAVIMRRDMAEYSIPARILTDAQVKAFVPGVTSHAQLGRVFGGSDHTDPGKGFPWDHLLTLLGGAEMTAADVWSYDPGDPAAPGAVLNQPFSSNYLTKKTVTPRWALGESWRYGHDNEARLIRIEATLKAVQETLDAILGFGGAGAAQVEALLNRTTLAVRPPSDPGPGS